MSVSFHGIGQVCATFLGDGTEGQVVKMSGKGTVAACSAGESFCGVALCAALYVAAYFLRTPVYMLMDGLLGRALAVAFDVARYALLAGTIIYGSVAFRRTRQNGAEENG